MARAKPALGVDHLPVGGMSHGAPGYSDRPLDPRTETLLEYRRSALALRTIGFSTRTVEALVSILRAAGIGLLVDVRTVPRSRHTPQWNREHAAVTLPRHGVRYHHVPRLGGFRKPRPDSRNTGWRNLSFRGYADYMATPEFASGLDELLALAVSTPTAIACTEAVPWRCHRSLIADALTIRDIAVSHLFGPGSARPHTLTPFARIEGLALIYPDPDSLLSER